VRVVVTGASGFLGTALVRSLRADGHDVVRLVRRAARAADEAQWDPAARRLDPAALAGADAVVHLAGAGVGDRRWTESYKREILASRIDGTTTVAAAIAALPDSQRPKALLSQSAVGYYGDTGEEIVDESAPSGEGFLADVVRQWEQCARPASDAGVRVVFSRTGLVLAADGGVLARMLPVFKLGLGGRLGSGRQWMSWITLPDQVAAMRFLLDSEAISGAVNVTSPEPVRNRDYTKALARAVHRPAIAVVPRVALHAAFGGFADEGVFVSQRVVAARLEDAGFAFTYADIDSALSALVG
jgi:uncharacterized protein (TIGR01777 family)